MSTLIFDIETIGEDYKTLDNVTKKILTRWIERSSKNDAEKNSLYQDIEAGLGFSPLTGYVVAIGLYDLERNSGVVYYTGEGNESETTDLSGFVYKQRSEKEMLEEFWEGAKHYDTFVTYNGRGFDVPFLFHRSAISGIKPSKNLLEGRYSYQQKSCRHLDLLDELTFQGAMYRKPSLHLFCRAYGIDSPKKDLNGDDVAKLFHEKKFRDIASYNAKDVIATKELYLKWRQYLAFNKNSPADQYSDEISYD